MAFLMNKSCITEEYVLMTGSINSRVFFKATVIVLRNEWYEKTPPVGAPYEMSAYDFVVAIISCFAEPCISWDKRKKRWPCSCYAKLSL
jgi:hypothetical protein